MSTRPFRFGIQVSTPAPGTTWADTARRIEGLGYDSLVVPDHFGEQYGPIVAMTVAATATTDLTVGCLVFDNDYRHPVVLAKEMATLALIAPGRVELGLGAGWMRWDYDVSGIAYDPPKTRVDRFEEGLAVIKGLLAGDDVDHHGEHYEITAMPGRPVPSVAPAIMIGGGGPRMLRLAVREADIVAITGRILSGAVDADAARDTWPDAVDQKVAWVRDAAGDRWGSFDMNCLVFLATVTDDARSVADGVAALFRGGSSVAHGVGAAMRTASEAGAGDAAAVDAAAHEAAVESVLGSPALVLGTVDEICDTLVARRERWGFNYVVFQGHDATEAMAPVVARLAGT